LDGKVKAIIEKSGYCNFSEVNFDWERFIAAAAAEGEFAPMGKFCSGMMNRCGCGMSGSF
jgi:hypothetical protein